MMLENLAGPRSRPNRKFIYPFQECHSCSLLPVLRIGYRRKLDMINSACLPYTDLSQGSSLILKNHSNNFGNYYKGLELTAPSVQRFLLSVLLLFKFKSSFRLTPISWHLETSFLRLSVLPPSDASNKS